MARGAPAVTPSPLFKNESAADFGELSSSLSLRAESSRGALRWAGGIPGSTGMLPVLTNSGTGRMPVLRSYFTTPIVNSRFA